MYLQLGVFEGQRQCAMLFAMVFLFVRCRSAYGFQPSLQSCGASA